MIVRIITNGLWISLALLVLGLCLFGDSAVVRRDRSFEPMGNELVGALRDPGTQWMVLLCTAIYFLAFAVLRRRLAGGGGAGEGGGRKTEDRGSIERTGWGMAVQWLGEPVVWLTGLMVLAAAVYAFDYPQAVTSTQALTLLGAAMIGQGAAFWESRKQ